ncbi:MAG: hypothetical protein OHK0012_21000 [Synechococcales cyanobacterium]
MVGTILWLAALPGLPDLTQPYVLTEVGSQVIQVGLVLLGVVALFGGVVALLNWSLGRSRSDWSGDWGYGRLLTALPHVFVVMGLVWAIFLGGSTLAIRYHDWEQARIAAIAEDVSGDRLEQRVPRLRYGVKVPITYTTYVDGRPVQVNEEQEEFRYLYPVQSDIHVDIQQQREATNRRLAYTVDFQGGYRFVNSLAAAQSFDLEIAIPSGYTVVQGVSVTQDGQPQPLPGEPRPAFTLDPGQDTVITLTNITQGGSRWIYDTEGQLLSQFRLTVVARFANAQFASGVMPTDVAANTRVQPRLPSLPPATTPNTPLDLATALITTPETGVTTYTWEYQDNVAVRDPFGVFTSTEGIRHTGILPRLLMLSPGILLWWLGLLYLSGPRSLRDPVVLTGCFGATLVLLTYLSRFSHPGIAFVVAAAVLLLLVAGMGRDPQQSAALILCTLCGVVLPILALMVPFTGITLAVAAVLSMAWLVVKTYRQPALSSFPTIGSAPTGPPPP